VTETNGNGGSINWRVQSLEKRMEKAEHTHEDFVALNTNMKNLQDQVERLRREEVTQLRNSVANIEKGQARTVLLTTAAIVTGLTAIASLILTAGGLPG
jgi:DNA anti-recombination protein RmuC